jgi:hypothetical protein
MDKFDALRRYGYIHINLSLESLYLLKKKLYQNLLGTYKDLSIYRDRQREAIYTIL